MPDLIDAFLEEIEYDAPVLDWNIAATLDDPDDSESYLKSMIDDVLRKHLPGHHNQLSHGRPQGGGDNGQFSEDAMAPAAEGFKRGNVIRDQTTGEVIGRSTGHCNSTLPVATKAAARWKSRHPGEEYLIRFSSVDNQYYIIQAGLRKVQYISKDPTPPVVVVTPEGSSRTEITDLFSTIGGRKANYTTHTSAYIEAGEKKFLDIISNTSGTIEFAPTNEGITDKEASDVLSRLDIHNLDESGFRIKVDIKTALSKLAMVSEINPDLGRALQKTILRVALNRFSDNHNNEFTSPDRIFSDDSLSADFVNYGSDWIETHVNVHERVPVCRVHKSHGSRSAYARRRDEPDGDAGIYVNPKRSGRSSVTHEYGHWLEFFTPGLYESANDFLMVRRASSKSISLARRGGYRGDRAWRNTFAHPYVGKIYSESTEVVSMGLDLFSSNPASFLRDDYDHFFFTLGVMSGGH